VRDSSGDSVWVKISKPHHRELMEAEDPNFLVEVAHGLSARTDRVGHLKWMESAPGPCGIAVATCRAHLVTRVRAWSSENLRPLWPRR
jgi:hypothetical protein